VKLVIQIPCYNEERTLPQTVRDLPTAIPGIDEIEILVIDDGSTDRTVAVARELGVHHILSFGRRCGLASAFTNGLETALSLGADIIVNTDGDNQYCGADVAKLVQPVLLQNADMVVGCRPIESHHEFSPLKKLLQRLGSAVLRHLSETSVPDAASGFRAFSRSSAQRLFLHSRFSHCIETLIQAGNLRLRIASVDIRVNPATRESRLYRSLPEYIWKSGMTMVAMVMHYRPSRVFGTLAAFCYLGILYLGLRFIFLVYLFPETEAHRTYIPSLILVATLAAFAAGLTLLAVVAEMIRSQTRLTEEVLFQLRRQSDDKEQRSNHQFESSRKRFAP